VTTNRRGDPQDRENCPVGFVIPELNITFHARFPGTAVEREYAALLALLESKIRSIGETDAATNPQS
jgi:hypothetical protein